MGLSAPYRKLGSFGNNSVIIGHYKQYKCIRVQEGTKLQIIHYILP